MNLEFVPFFGIDTLEAAWEIVSGANAANGGIMFDTWHHRRSGSTDAFLATIPGARITGVQVKRRRRHGVRGCKPPRGMCDAAANAG